MVSLPLAQPQPQQQQQQRQQDQLQCNPRLTFWIVAGASWVVWMFAVAAGADDKWLREDSTGEELLAAGEDYFLNFCDEIENDSVYQDFCDTFKAFTAMQIIATIACSFSVLLLSLAFFRPSRGGCSSARSLAFVGGGLMATYALFQLIAVVLGETVMQELEDAEFQASGYTYEAELGPTFGVAVTGLALATVCAVLLLLFASCTGDGPLHECCHSLMVANRANGNPVTGAGDGLGREKQAPVFGAPMPASNPVPSAAATAPTAPHHHEEAGALPLPQTATATATAPAADEQQQQQQQQQPRESAPPPYDELAPAAD